MLYFQLHFFDRQDDGKMRLQSRLEKLSTVSTDIIDDKFVF